MSVDFSEQSFSILFPLIPAIPSVFGKKKSFEIESSELIESVKYKCVNYMEDARARMKS